MVLSLSGPPYKSHNAKHGWLCFRLIDTIGIDAFDVEMELTLCLVFAVLFTVCASHGNMLLFVFFILTVSLYTMFYLIYLVI